MNQDDVSAIPPLVRADPPTDKLKEWVAAMLSVAIVSGMLVLMSSMFVEPAPPDAAWQRQSGLLQVLVGFAGTVTGYYFGRIPAERAATTAQHAATTAQANLASASSQARHAIDNERQLRTQVGALRDHLSAPFDGASGMAPDDARATLAMRLDQILGS